MFWQNFYEKLSAIFPGDPFSITLFLVVLGYICLLALLSLGLVGVTLNLHYANQRKGKKWRSLENRWEPLVLDVLAGNSPPETVQKSVLPEESFYFIDYLMRYAERISGQQKDLICELAEPHTSLLLSRIKVGDAEQRARAIQTLSELAPHRHKEALLEALKDESPLVSMLAARSLAENQWPDVVPQILEHFSRFRAWSSQFLSSMLVSMGPKSLEVLRRELNHPEQSVHVQTVILKALTELNDWSALPEVTQILIQTDDINLQAAALQFMAKVGEPELAVYIRPKVNSSSSVIRLHAIKALGQLGWPEDVEIFQRAMDDDSQWVARQAARALKLTNHTDVLEAIADSDHPRASLARQVFYDFETPHYLEQMAQEAHFIQKVDKFMEFVRYKNTRSAWESVHKIFFSPRTNPEVRYAFAQVLKPEDQQRFFSDVMSQLILQEFTDNLSLICALKSLGNAEAVPTLIQYYEEKARVREKAEVIAALQVLKTEESRLFLEKERSSSL